MGNRAVITTPDKTIAVYLHWNGGRDSVEAFLKFCELKKYRPPSEDSYGWARLITVAANTLGADDGLCVGVGAFADIEDSAHRDNGVYIIRGWAIVGREGVSDGFEEQHEHSLADMLTMIDEAQGERGKLPSDVLQKAIQEAR
jgi:hypothetical protein